MCNNHETIPFSSDFVANRSCNLCDFPFLDKSVSMHFLSQLRAPSNGQVISSSVSIPESSSSSSDGGFSPRVLYRFLAFAFSIFRLN